MLSQPETRITTLLTFDYRGTEVRASDFLPKRSDSSLSYWCISAEFSNLEPDLA